MAVPQSATRSLSHLPGLRTFASARFRLAAAVLLAILGVALNAVMLMALWDSPTPWLEDFEPYYAAAVQVAAGESAYFPEQLTEPVPAWCPGCYLYPPPLAVALRPLTALPLETAKVVFFALLSFASWASLWLATGVGGARRTLERALWCLVAVTFFLPTFQSNWIGNVGSLLGLFAVMVAMGGAVAGVGAALGVLLKVSPGALIPAVLVESRRSRIGFIVSLGLIGGAVLLIAPTSSIEYVSVLLNIQAGDKDLGHNLALVTMADRAGWPDALVTVVRVGVLIVGVALIAASAWIARRAGGMPAAAALGVAAMLLLPGTFWNHYVATALPIVAMAWPRASDAWRLAMLLVAMVVAYTAVGFAPLVTVVGTGIMLAGATAVLWPRRAVRDVAPAASARGLPASADGTAP